MKLSTRAIAAAVLLVGTATAFSITMNNNADKSSSVKIIESSSSRRGFLNTAAATATATTSSVLLPKLAIADDADPYADFTTTESGLRYKVTKEGTGAIPSAGQTVKAHYTGWLEGFDSIRKFDSSRDRGRPFTFRVGAGQVIRGWDESFASMKVGERRQIILPPRLGYGDRGAGGIIPGGATLYFDVELLGIL
mmetsp:Transcript_7624/g.10386  ORF Transcript_7624/g.10386 Transcript_7624/m.10386 type:complete len:194 (-) Transcript_7624:358-939(-)|eukprot:CAMPEP_0185724204 /NCGR_PEP_ID=MMETSP1171-20130828/756_1 /TAXON_ID=374046 /ORGANISM="Helicotheca tamensis, Strain CCMP826" /LENGTH=193 /DNA_ID=CAMNT_0028392005 /DNA_START=101 /DNA_END=682 /DNA_ORIENTATION=-